MMNRWRLVPVVTMAAAASWSGSVAADHVVRSGSAAAGVRPELRPRDSCRGYDPETGECSYWVPDPEPTSPAQTSPPATNPPSGGSGSGGGSSNGGGSTSTGSDSGGSTGSTSSSGGAQAPSFSDVLAAGPFWGDWDIRGDQGTFVPAASSLQLFSGDLAAAMAVIETLATELTDAKGADGSSRVVTMVEHSIIRFLTRDEFVALYPGEPAAAGWYDQHLADLGFPTTNWEAMIADPALNITPNQAQTDLILGFLAERWATAQASMASLTSAAFADGTVTLDAPVSSSVPVTTSS